MRKGLFKVGSTYSRKDIYRIIKVPKEKQKGNWNTGYNRFNGEWFIFTNVKTAGRTGHDHPNKFIGNELEWYGKNSSNPSQESFKSLIDPNTNVYIFSREDSSNPNFTYMGKGTAKKVYNTAPIKILWSFIDSKENHPEILAEEVNEPEKYIEGLTKTISVNIYERNPIARNKCIEYYGLNCSVCNFNFRGTYGKLGEGFIHVHHLKPLHEIKEEYEVDAIKDLRPVCPNCHAMLHRKKPAYTIQELKELLS